MLLEEILEEHDPSFVEHFLLYYPPALYDISIFDMLGAFTPYDIGEITFVPSWI